MQLAGTSRTIEAQLGPQCSFRNKILPPAVRRPQVTALRIVAGDDKPEKRIKQSQKAIQGAVTAIESSLSAESADITSALNTLSRASERLAGKEDQLWQRQESIYQREVARWQEERASWAAREAALTLQVAELQSALVRLATGSTAGLGTAPAAAVASTPLPSPSEVSSASARQSTAHTSPLREPGQLGIDFSSGVASPTRQQPVEEAAPSADEPVAPTGPPPKLSKGVDDIFWTHQLQKGLTAHGFSIDDEEVEDWIFGEATENALLTFQACSSLKENGITTADTWRRLLGEQLPNKDLLDAGSALAAHAAPADSLSQDSRLLNTDVDASTSPPSDLWAAESADPLTGDLPVSQASSSSSSSSNGVLAPQQDEAHADLPFRDLTEWPTLSDGDGGRNVHHLHVALRRNGFDCHNDDLLWWQYSDSTQSAVQYFQASASLPQTGIADDDTWQALLGPHAKPSDIDTLFSDNENDQDMCGNQKGVWLLGEQRWSRVAY